MSSIVAQEDDARGTYRPLGRRYLTFPRETILDVSKRIVLRFLSATTSDFGAISLGCITLVTYPGKGGVGSGLDKRRGIYLIPGLEKVHNLRLRNLIISLNYQFSRRETCQLPSIRTKSPKRLGGDWDLIGKALLFPCKGNTLTLRWQYFDPTLAIP